MYFLIFYPFSLLSVVDGKGIVAVADAVAVEAFTGFALTDDALVVKVVGALALGAGGCAAGMEGEGLGDVLLLVAVATGKVVAGDDGVVGAQFGDVGQADNETSETHVEARVVVDLGTVDGGAAGGVGKDKLGAGGSDGTPLPHAVDG